MADLSTNIPQMTTGQASKEVTFNSQIDAGSQALTFGRNVVTSTGLTFGYLGGRLPLAGANTVVANGTVVLQPSRTQQVECAPVSTTTTAITGISIANPCVITVASHPYFVGEVLWISGITGTTQLNGSFARITAATGTTLTIDTSSVGFAAWSSGGTVARMTDNGTFGWQVGKTLATVPVTPFPLYQCVAGASTITDYVDNRVWDVPLAGAPSIAVGGAVDVVATALQANAIMYGRRFVNLTGVLTGNISFLLPRLTGDFIVRNSTTGAFSLTVKCPGSTGTVVATSAIRHLLSDGADVIVPA